MPQTTKFIIDFDSSNFSRGSTGYFRRNKPCYWPWSSRKLAIHHWISQNKGMDGIFDIPRKSWSKVVLGFWMRRKVKSWFNWCTEGWKVSSHLSEIRNFFRECLVIFTLSPRFQKISSFLIVCRLWYPRILHVLRNEFVYEWNWKNHWF